MARRQIVSLRDCAGIMLILDMSVHVADAEAVNATASREDGVTTSLPHTESIVGGNV